MESAERTPDPRAELITGAIARVNQQMYETEYCVPTYTERQVRRRVNWRGLFTWAVITVIILTVALEYLMWKGIVK